MTITDWIIAIANSITALTVVIIWYQLKIDHERSRREKAVDMLGFFAKNQTRDSSFARKLAENFDFEQSKSLHNIEPFQIDEKYQDTL